jgi:hypothetical protein
LGAFDSITKGIDVIKILITADKELALAELKMKLTEVYSTLIDAKNEMVNLKEENLKLRRELEGKDTVGKLRKEFRLKEISNYFILDKEIDGHKPGNYCSACFQKTEVAIVILPHWPGFQCPSCKAIYVN